MVIWLRNATEAMAVGGAGASSEVIRREDAGRLVELDEGFEMLADEREAVLEQARREAQTLLDDARCEAEALKNEALQMKARAEEEGYNAGMARALAAWHDRAASADTGYRRVRERMRERLAELVTQAVEQIVVTEDAKTLFERALSTVDRIAEKASYLTVCVNPADHDEAERVFGRFADESAARGRIIKLIVQDDKRLAPGSCICESDFGVVDASLDTQIRALKAATERALAGSAMPSGVSGDPEEEANEGIDAIGAIEAGSDDGGDEMSIGADFHERRDDHVD